MAEITKFDHHLLGLLEAAREQIAAENQILAEVADAFNDRALAHNRFMERMAPVLGQRRKAQTMDDVDEEWARYRSEAARN